MQATESIIKLNVGGRFFQTKKSTLTKSDGFFKTMLETDVPINKDESGTIFIDRNPAHFGKILDYMRDGKIVLPHFPEAVEEIQNEAQYYLLDGLVKLCDAKLDKKFEDSIRNDRISPCPAYDAKKPIFLFYYPKNTLGNVHFPEGFNIRKFVERYEHKMYIYYYDVRTLHLGHDRVDATKWHWRMAWGHANDSTEDPVHYYDATKSGRFLGCLEGTIQEFFKKHNLTL